MAIPEDSGAKEKKNEKVENCQNLARELRRMWEVKTIVVPIVVGVLGTVPLRLKDNLKEIEVDTSISLIQKSALLGSVRLLRKVLEMYWTERRTIWCSLATCCCPASWP